MTGPGTETPRAFDSAPQGVEPSAAHFLACVQALTTEIRIALDAIAANDLLTLTDSICRQEDLCFQLDRMPRPDDALAMSGSTARAWAKLWDDVESQIETAVEDLRQVSAGYALVLQTSSRSISLLTSLCRGFAGDVAHASPDRSPNHAGSLTRRTWSCEA
ncbi:hypothetical protein SAMN05421819_0648 [Bryocella elongata]|uniref:FlgN protein n=1 Tax=Bryocella elongata TaxID=863522 RepID=A0A1H5TKK3_9BACT|nr:hypothetical protein [Bryocella elongata]SEF63293.1 hypothetical protein SAMN05421819_0648 [Bryocella elongata]